MNKPTGLVACGLLAIASSSAFAARPLISNDPYPLEKGKWQLELGVNYAQDHADHEGQLPAVITYGIATDWEVAVGVGGQLSDHGTQGDQLSTEGGWMDTSIAVKHKFLDQKEAWLDQAFAVGAFLPTSAYSRSLGTGRPAFDLTWILSRQVTEKLALHANLGYTWRLDRSEEEFSDLIHYSLATTYQLTPELQPVAEILFSNPVETGRPAAGVNVGLRWQIAPNLTLDGAVGTGILGSFPDLLTTVGFTLVW